jgi:type III pantothenate kinase
VNVWLFDLGNTRLKLARLDAEGNPGEVATAAHDGVAFVAGWQDALPSSAEAAWIASVGPSALRAQLAEAMAARGARVHYAVTLPRFAGVTVAYADPARLGVDRLLAMAAARARDPAAALVVGVGTAITVDLLGSDGRHRGGRIAPSPALMRDALRQRTPQLPGEGGDYVEFGDDTASALASGCIGAALGLVERSVRQARALLGVAPRLCLHGGGAVALHAHLGEAEHAPALVLEGLALWAQRVGHDAD